MSFSFYLPFGNVSKLGKMENLSSDDEADDMSEGSDLQQFSDDEFSSDTDSVDNDNLTQETVID